MVETFTLKNFVFKTKPWEDRKSLKLSEFDIKMQSTWKDALKRGCFLHGVESVPKRIPGDKGYTGLLCENRPDKKRPSHVFKSLRQPIDPKAFNFSKISDEERLFNIYLTEKRKDMVTLIINNSPYEFGHSLMVPEIDKLHNQCMMGISVRLGINILLSSAHPGFRVMFNSLCGGASVNHLHLHGYYTEYWLNSEVYNMNPLFDEEDFKQSRSEYCLEDCYVLDAKDSGFIINERNYKEELPKTILKIVDYLTDNDIAHNMVFIRGKDVCLKSCQENESCVKFMQKHDEKDQSCILFPDRPFIENDTPVYDCVGLSASHKPNYLVGRIYLFPRKSSFLQKDYRKFLVNVTELFGHLYFGDRFLYENMTENDIIKALQDVSFSLERFNEIKNIVKKLFR